MYVDPFPGVLSIEKASRWRNNNIFRSPEEVRAGSVGSHHILSQRKKDLRESQRGAGFITFTIAVIGNRRRSGMGFRTPTVALNEALSCDSRFGARKWVKLSRFRDLSTLQLVQSSYNPSRHHATGVFRHEVKSNECQTTTILPSL